MTSDKLTNQGLRDCLISPNEADRNFEPANVVDGLFAIARAMWDIAKSIDNLTEAVKKQEDLHIP